MTSQDYKALDEDEIAELSQEVVYRIIAGLNKELDEFIKRESEKIDQERIIRSPKFS